MKIDELDTAYGLAQVGQDEAQYIRSLQKFFDQNLQITRKIETAFRDDLIQEAISLATELHIAAQLVGAHVIAREAEALAFAFKDEWPSAMIERQIGVLEAKLQTLLEDVRWYL